jgi:dimethylpropiothetin dethiomethylase
VANEADNDSQALDCTNPSHAQDGIIESSVCQSGAVSENHLGVYATEAMIFSPPGQRHRITVSNREPTLMAYAWMGPKDKLADQKMVFWRKWPGSSDFDRVRLVFNESWKQ